jgi:uncharacterized protein
MTDPTSPLARRLASPWAFIAFVFVWTWGFWLSTIFLGISATTPTGLVLALCGLIGPMAGGILFTYLTRDKEWRRDYWIRMFNPRRFVPRWYLTIFLLMPVLMSLTAIIDLLTGGAIEPYRERAVEIFGDPSALPIYLLFILLCGPLPEEFGWHGYLLDRLQERHSVIKAAVFLGFIWGAWHIPLFYMPGTYQFMQGPFTVWFWTFMIGIVPLEIVMAWIFNSTNRSTFGIVIFHFMVVLTCNFLNATPGANVISTLLWFVLAFIVVRIWPREKRIAASVYPA